MARVFTITPGLENMGALKTGGQGSVYKGRRIGEIITAVKILPTPVFSESAADKNYLAFANEVAKLKKVNEVPNPNVVKIISSGISDTGNFPFIEMEYIEGPDLEELLQPPHNSIFTLSETLKVAEQLANALAHCHKMDVKHGDIKSNNVKFNTETGNYVLLDFGLAIMSDEQRRSSYRQIVSIEFMAPEQNTGQMLFQTDVYSFGIIIFELLTGTVPFPLKGKGESARNDVRLAHMVLPVPDIINLRRSALSSTWNNKKQEQEMELPQWLLKMVYKCLEKKPERRFNNGLELQDYLTQQFLLKREDPSSAFRAVDLEEAKKVVLKRHEEVKSQLAEYRRQLLNKEDELLTLKKLLQQERAFQPAPVHPVIAKKRVATMSFIALLMVMFALAAFVLFPRFKDILLAKLPATNNGSEQPVEDTMVQSQVPLATTDPNENSVTVLPAPKTSTADSATEKPVDQKINQDNSQQQQNEPPKELEKPEEIRPEKKQVPPPVKATETGNEENHPAERAGNNSTTNDNTPAHTEPPAQENNDAKNATIHSVSKKYLVVAKAYFYNEPDENTRRDESISPLEHAVVQALNERYGFIYVVITDPQGRVFKGWLRKSDLKLYAVE